MSFPSMFSNPAYWSRVKIGGLLIVAPLREIDGIKLEGTWDEQKPTDKSGASFNWKGLKPNGPHKLTLESAYGPGITPEDCERNMRVVHEMMLPAPSLGVAAASTVATTTTTPGSAFSAANTGAPSSMEGILAQAKQALANLNNPAKEKDPTAGTTGAAATTAAANPGPRPPTLSVENGFVNYVGTMAVSLKSFEIKATKSCSLQYVVEVVPQKALAKAGTGLAPPKSPDAAGLAPAAQGNAQATAGDALALSSGSGT